MAESTDIEFSPQRLDQLTLIAASGDDEALVAAVTDIPRLVLEVTRLRQELAERVGQRDAAKRQVAELKGLIEAMRPGQDAQARLEELKNQIAGFVARAERAERAKMDTDRQLEAAEKRIQALITSLSEVSRAQGGDALEQAIKRAEAAENEVQLLRERVARLERMSG